MNTAWLHAITIICHTLVLIMIVIAVIILAGEHLFNSDSIVFFATLAGGVGTGLVINGRKVPQPGQRAEDIEGQP